MYILGLMSGTSLDGLDIAYCKIDDDLSYTLLAAETVPYPPLWQHRLAHLHEASALEYAQADVDLGHYIGAMVNNFRLHNEGPIDAIASHGHTVFHQPHRKLTAQIGDGNAIAAETHLTTVFDFRRYDVALGGQGAPLVPIGDRLLFPEADCCVNLGGFANLSFECYGQRLAYDICPCNMILNKLSVRESMPYDADGRLAAQGSLMLHLLETLELLDYYSMQPPKSLGKEWFESFFWPLFQNYASSSTADLLRTAVEHIALRLAAAVSSVPNKQIKVLFTGGGAYNRFLLERFLSLCPHANLVSVDKNVIDYKEAIIFALLGYLRLRGQVNTLSSVTGAQCDSMGGVVCG